VITKKRHNLRIYKEVFGASFEYHWELTIYNTEEESKEYLVTKIKQARTSLGDRYLSFNSFVNYAKKYNISEFYDEDKGVWYYFETKTVIKKTLRQSG